MGEGDGTSGPQTGGERPPPAPRWVKVAAAVAAAVLVLLVVRLVTGSEHGPGRHTLGPSSTGELIATETHVPGALSG